MHITDSYCVGFRYIFDTTVEGGNERDEDCRISFNLFFDRILKSFYTLIP